MLLRNDRTRVSILGRWLATSVGTDRFRRFVWIWSSLVILGVACGYLLQLTLGYPYESELQLLGWPLVATGDNPVGWISVGEYPKGIIAIGGVALGVISLGGVAVGPLGFGGIAVGVLALGGTSVGWLATGGVAVGWYANGGTTVGTHAVGNCAYGLLTAQAKVRQRLLFDTGNST